MLLYDDIYAWKGWGGKLQLASGRCRLRIYNLEAGGESGLRYLKPVIVLATDDPASRMSIRSCAGHIATSIRASFALDPQQMLFVEYSPEKIYGVGGKQVVPECYEVVEFSWRNETASQPVWRQAPPSLSKILKKLVASSP
jgi:hypothetical protein